MFSRYLVPRDLYEVYDPDFFTSLFNFIMEKDEIRDSNYFSKFIHFFTFASFVKLEIKRMTGYRTFFFFFFFKFPTSPFSLRCSTKKVHRKKCPSSRFSFPLLRFASNFASPIFIAYPETRLGEKLYPSKFLYFHQLSSPENLASDTSPCHPRPPRTT